MGYEDASKGKIYLMFTFKDECASILVDANKQENEEALFLDCLHYVVDVSFLDDVNKERLTVT